jgi:rfaE bifunctional protein nucleotidyltransferase chain/domain
VAVIALPQEGGTREKTRVRSRGQSLMRLDRGGPATPVGDLPADARAAIRDADVVLVSCYGAGVSRHEGIRAAVAARAHHGPVVWDPHPRGGPPVPGCTLVTPNLAEARAAAGLPRDEADAIALWLVEAWAARGVAVTVGDAGAWLARPGSEPLFVPATPVAGDSCGAGDRFAATAALATADGLTASEAVGEAVSSASAFVASGGASGFRSSRARPTAPSARTAAPPAPDDAEAVLARVRADGGTVVATGGCFDVLHAGHVQSLSGARRLGDALVVLLNSDESARRLKGPNRPVHSVADRAMVLLGLSCVDAVVVFDEDDPRVALRRLRPDIWAKGADYEGVDIAEGDLVRSWGGRVVLLPYLSGRSTTAILHELTEGAHRAS